MSKEDKGAVADGPGERAPDSLASAPNVGAEEPRVAPPWTRKVDNFLRFFDLRVQSFDAGTPLERLLRIQRHTMVSYLWPAVICTAVVTGMPVISLGRGVTATVVLFVATVTLLLLARLTLARSVAWDAYWQAGLVLFLCGLVGVIGRDRVPEQGGIYVHTLVPAAVIFALSVVISALITPACFHEHARTTKYPAGIAETQLFQLRPKALPTGAGAFVQALVLTLARLPVLLLPPCLVAMLVPREWLGWSAWTVLVPLFLLVVSGLDERVDQIVGQLSAPFSRNGGAVVSTVVIVLGVARFADVSYVATVLDTAAGAQIAIYLCYGYAVVWWQDYWIARLAGQEMLRIAGGESIDRRQMHIDYGYTGDNDGIPVPIDGRSIRLHGLGRFLVVRPKAFDREINWEQPPFWVGRQFPAFHTWTFAEFFHHVASHAYPKGNAQPSPHKIAHRLMQHATIVRLLTIAALIIGAIALSKLEQVAAAEVRTTKPTLNLGELIERHPAERPVILIAASGGGTRAALYTAAVLEALAQRDAIGDVLLGSGVSGGGASLAYFAAMRNNLNWTAYFDAMQQSYIRDVLERSSEWRIVAGRRLGTLLEESFDRHWDLPGDRVALGQVAEMGLIFNTAIAGHFEASEPFDLASQASSKPNLTTLAGGRLIITNLQTDAMFHGVNGPYGVRLPVVVNDPSLKLSTAAGLNANFPPVFSNAPIDVDQRFRYWVTDGGAADNRGVEMLLYALRHALRERPSIANRRILVLIVDAGAAPGEYSQDRGIGSAMGAGAQFAMHLVAELARDVGSKVRLLHVPMPLVLRESFGTHWMLQGTIRVGDDEVSGTDMVQILRGLYARGSCDHVVNEKARKACAIAMVNREFCEPWWEVDSWLAGSPLPRPPSCPADEKAARVSR